MGEKSDQLERHIRDERDELGQHIGELHQKVKNAVDWRVQFKERPMTMIGLAFGGGILLSTLLSGKPRPNGRKRLSDQRPRVSLERESNPKIESRTETMRPEAGGVSVWEKTSDTLDTVRGALFAVVATKIENYLEQIIPGFKDQYRKSEARKN